MFYLNRISCHVMLLSKNNGWTVLGCTFVSHIPSNQSQSTTKGPFIVMSYKETLRDRKWLPQMFLSFVPIWVVEFCQNFSCWILSQFWILLNIELYFVLIQVFFLVLLQFQILTFITICFFLSVFKKKLYMSFVTIFVSEFCHNLSKKNVVTLWHIKMLSFVTF